jgi:hypothetical protein
MIIVCESCYEPMQVPNATFFKAPIPAINCPHCGAGVLEATPIDAPEELMTPVSKSYQNEPQGLACLAVVLPNGAQKMYYLLAGATTVGRYGAGSDTQLQVDTTDPFMSRLHFIIDLQDTGAGIAATVLDLGSKNGTTVKGSNGISQLHNRGMPIDEGMVIVAGNTNMQFQWVR